MLAVQGQEDLCVHPAEALQFEDLSTDGGLAAEHRELRTFPRHCGVGGNRLGQKHFHGFRRLQPDDGHGVDGAGALGLLLDDAGLLPGDGGDVGAEEFGVIHPDRGDDRHRGVDDIGGIPTAAESDLDDPDVDRGVGEGGERHRGDDFELAHPRAAVGLRLRVDQLHERLDLTIGFDVKRRADRDSVDGDTFGGRLQVRARGTAGTPTERGQQGVDHPRHRGLAVGTRDMDAGVGPLRVVQQFHQRDDPVRRRLDPGFRPTLVQQVFDLQQCGDLVGGGFRIHRNPASRAVMRSTSSPASR